MPGGAVRGFIGNTSDHQATAQRGRAGLVVWPWGMSCCGRFFTDTAKSRVVKGLKPGVPFCLNNEFEA